MQPKAKANSVVTSSFDPATRVITYTVLHAGKITLDLTKVSAACVNRAAAHGFVQRVVDSAAIPAEPLPEGEEAQQAQAVARAQRKFTLMQRLAEHYETGTDEWSPARAEGGPGLDGVLIRAVMEVTGKDEAAIRALITANVTKANEADPKAKLTERAYLAKLGTGAKVAEVANRMRAEIAPAVDADAEIEAMKG